MKNKLWTIFPTLVMGALLLTGCEAIGSIFKAGVGTGVILVIVILALVIFIVGKLFSRNKNS